MNNNGLNIKGIDLDSMRNVQYCLRALIEIKRMKLFIDQCNKENKAKGFRIGG